MIIECKSRTEARTVAKESNGKVVDNGSAADVRWTVKVETKSDMIKLMANEFGVEVVSVPLCEVQPEDLKGVPVAREVLSINSQKTYFSTDPELMRRRGQGKQVEVYTRKQYQSRLA